MIGQGRVVDRKVEVGNRYIQNIQLEVRCHNLQQVLVRDCMHQCTHYRDMSRQTSALGMLGRVHRTETSSQIDVTGLVQATHPWLFIRFILH